jgi:signal transduction histidine kinase
VLEEHYEPWDRWFENRIYPSADGLTIYFTEVTERRRGEEALRQLNVELEGRVAQRTAELQAKNRELESFTHSVSHDLKAPLRGIDGYSRLLLEDHADELDEEGRAFLHNVREATTQMSRLIDDLLAYSRLERRPLHGRIDLRPFVDALLADRGDEIRARGVRDRGAEVVVSADRRAGLAVRNLIGTPSVHREVPRPTPSAARRRYVPIVGAGQRSAST